MGHAGEATVSISQQLCIFLANHRPPIRRDSWGFRYKNCQQ